MIFLCFFFRLEVLYGIYGNKGAIRVGDFKLIMGETYTPPSPRPLSRGEMQNLMKPVTVWDSELDCPDYPDAIGCWPDIAPCLFNVRFDPCEKNNLAYFMPQTVEALVYSLNRYNLTVNFRTKRHNVHRLRKENKKMENYFRTLKKLKRSRRTLDREAIVR